MSKKQVDDGRKGRKQIHCGASDHHPLDRGKQEINNEDDNTDDSDVHNDTCAFVPVVHMLFIFWHCTDKRSISTT